MDQHLPRVIIAHSNPEMARTLANSLAPSFDVYTARDVQKVLHLVEDTEVHVVVVDAHLPGMPWTDLFAKLKAIRPSVARILITPSLNLQVSEAINEGYVHRYLIEPLTSSSFIEVVKGGVKLYGMLRARQQGEAAHTPSTEDHVSEAEKLERAKTHLEEISRQSMTEKTSNEEHEQLVQALRSLSESQEETETLRARLAEAEALKEQNEKDLASARQENSDLQERVAEFDQRYGALASETAALQEQLKSMKELQEVKEVTPDELRNRIVGGEIYDRAAQWANRAAKLLKMQSVFEIELQEKENEVLRLEEEHKRVMGELERGGRMFREESNLLRLKCSELTEALREKEEELASCRRKSMEYQTLISQMKQQWSNFTPIGE